MYSSVDDFLSVDEHPNGTLTIYHRGLPIDFLNDRRGYDTVMVLFHAALAKPGTQFPVFTGVNITHNLPVNRIFVADPSIYLDEKLTLAWYAGSQVQPDLQDVISIVLASLTASNTSTITFGASGGGFAAMHYSSRLSCSMAIPVNPQIDLADYVPGPVRRWLRLGWNLDPDKEGLDAIPAVTDSGSAYRGGSSAKVWYVQNIGDSNHMNNHYLPFMKSLPDDHGVVPILIDAGVGHVPPKKVQLEAILRAAAEGEAFPPSSAELNM